MDRNVAVRGGLIAASAAGPLLAAEPDIVPGQLLPLHSWICTNHWQFRVPSPLTAAGFAIGRYLSWRRLPRQCWIRYVLPIDPIRWDLVIARAGAIQTAVTPLRERDLGELVTLAPTANQLISGLRFWEAGLRRGFLARNHEGTPLAVIWVLRSDDNGRLARLPGWSGMYPSIPAGWLQLENIYCFSHALRRGQVLNDLVHLAAVAASPTPAIGILAHIHESNRIARRWIEHFGCRPYGGIRRLNLDLPWLRRHPWYVHTLDIPPPPAQRRGGARRAIAAR